MKLAYCQLTKLKFVSLVCNVLESEFFIREFVILVGYYVLNNVNIRMKINPLQKEGDKKE